MRHTMRSETLTPERILEAAEREYAAVRAEMVRLARELWPTWRPDEPMPDRRGGARPRRPRRDRRRAPRRRRPARLLPRGERPDRGVLRGARPHRPRRRAARDPLDAGLPARLRRRDARSRRARSTRARPAFFAITPDPRRLDAGAARVVPARGQRPDAPAADDPRGRARPLPPGRLRQPVVVAAAERLPERPVRRGLGGVRDPGDDGRRVRRGRSGAAAHPLEVLPALGHQRDHRRPDPLRRR